MEGLKFIRNVLDNYNIKNEINLLPDGTEIVNFAINGKSSTYNICVKQLDTNEYYIYTTLMQVSKNARHSICKALNEYNKKYSIVKLFYNEEEQAALLYASCCVPPLTTFGTVDFFDKILAAFIPALDGIMSEIPVLEFQGKEKKVVFTDGRPVVKIDKISNTPMDVITNSNNTLEERPVKEDDTSSDRLKNTTFFAATYGDADRLIFWELFKQALDENGNPFLFAENMDYAIINKNNTSSKLCLRMDFLVRKNYLRIGIYIEDDTITPHYDRLLSHKQDIEEKLGFAPIWNNSDEINPNTRRIEYRIGVIPYDHKYYKRVIEAALPIVARYIEVFSVYLPQAFEEDNQKHEQCVLQSEGICSPMFRNIHKGYGRAAQPIYDECCRVFNWDSSKRHLFGRQQLLYSVNATPEGYSVWFLVHSNWTATKGGKWYNKIEGDTIEEMWLSEKGGLQDTSIRVTFAKMKTREYSFIGIYAPLKLEEKIITSDIVTSNQGVVAKAGESVWIKTYRLISDQYPK